MSHKPNRVYILDAIRGFAVLGMIVHHAYVLLNSMCHLEMAFFDSTLFSVLQTAFVAVFLLVSGICTNYSRNVAKRGAIIFVAAILVTLVTGVILPRFGMPNMEIWFGILHMFGFSMLLYALLYPLLKKCNTYVILIISAVLYAAFVILQHNYPTLEGWGEFGIIFGFPPAGFYSADYYPIFPHFFMFVIGAMIGRLVVANKFPHWFYTVRIRPLEWIGKHSLVVYLLHQPIIMAIIMAFQWMNLI